MLQKNMQFRMTTSKILKCFRLKNNLSPRDVIFYLSKHHIQNVRTNTLYAWESGQALPNVFTFLHLCHLYHITNILETFQITNASGIASYPILILSSHEEQLILAYRCQPESHAVIKKILNI